MKTLNTKISACKVLNWGRQEWVGGEDCWPLKTAGTGFRDLSLYTLRFNSYSGPIHAKYGGKLSIKEAG